MVAAWPFGSARSIGERVDHQEAKARHLRHALRGLPLVVIRQQRPASLTFGWCSPG
jgi:hypothetical protein